MNSPYQRRRYPPDDRPWMLSDADHLELRPLIKITPIVVALQVQLKSSGWIFKLFSHPLTSSGPLNIIPQQMIPSFPYHRVRECGNDRQTCPFSGTGPEPLLFHRDIRVLYLSSLFR